MTTYVAIVFSSSAKAHAGLRALWHLDDKAEITVHGAAIVRRDDMGNIQVADKHTDMGMRTAIGVSIGALLGLIAGPIGVAAGVAGAASLAAGTAAGVGALAGGAIGIAADAITDDDRDNAARESFFSLAHGQSAVVAEISEDWTYILDDAMTTLGGTVHRRENTAETSAAFGSDYYGGYLYPYYNEPYFD